MPAPEFKIGDKIQCYHKTMFYDAKIVNSKPGPKGEHLYLVHYIGWKPKWDEWISSKAERIKSCDADLGGAIKASAANRGRHRLPKKGKAKGTDEPTKSNTSSAETKNETEEPGPSVEEETSSLVMETTEANVEPEQQPETEPTEKRTCVKLTIPPRMEEWLQEDYYQINGLKKLANIPAPKTVHDILEDYVKEKCPAIPPSQHAYLMSVVAQVENLFNVTCGSNLIYNYEHPHYREILRTFEGVRMARLYGFPHLLRLFYVLMTFFETRTLTDVGSTIADIEDILRFACEHGDEYFKITGLYGMASADYARVAHQPL